MNRLSVKLTLVVVTLLFVASTLTGCMAKNLGVEMVAPRNALVRYSVKSHQTKFNVNDVTLSFSYGSPNNMFAGDSRLACFAAYFCDGQYYLAGESTYYHSLDVEKLYKYDDYHDIIGHYLVKEIPADEFGSDKYYCKPEGLFGKGFNHSETLTVPSGVFERESGSFVFKVVGIVFTEKYNAYCLINLNLVSVAYEYIDEQTILLSYNNSIWPH